MASNFRSKVRAQNFSFCAGCPASPICPLLDWLAMNPRLIYLTNPTWSYNRSRKNRRPYSDVTNEKFQGRKSIVLVESRSLDHKENKRTDSGILHLISCVGVHGSSVQPIGWPHNVLSASDMGLGIFSHC